MSDTKSRYNTTNPIFQLALFSTTSMTVLGSVVISPSLPAMKAHFLGIAHIDILIPLILTTPALFVVLFSPIAGILADKYGKLKFLFPSMVFWGVAGAIGFWLDNVYHILISRAIFGIATAFVMVCASALVGDYYSGVERQRALGKQGFGTACGSAIFVSLGGYLSSFDWRFPFLVYLLGFLVFIFAYFYLFEPRIEARFKVAAQTSSQSHFSFFLFLPIYLLAFGTMVTYYISPTQIPFFITDYLHQDPKIIGFSMTASSIAYGTASLFYQRLRNRFNIYRIYTFALISMASCFLIIYVFHSYIAVIIGLMFLGAGCGLMIVNNSSFLLSIAKDSIRARALGGLSSFVFLGHFSSPLLTQPIVQHFGLFSLFLFFAIFIYLLGILFAIKSFYV